MVAAGSLLKEWIIVSLVGVVLLAYLMAFVPEVITSWKRQASPPNEARTYIWTALGAIIGGIAAFYLGVGDLQPATKALASGNPPSIEQMRATYAIVYVLTGLAALATWYARTDFTSPLLKNAATTFGGLAAAVVSARLLPPT